MTREDWSVLLVVLGAIGMVTGAWLWSRRQVTDAAICVEAAAACDGLPESCLSRGDPLLVRVLNQCVREKRCPPSQTR